MEIASGRRKQDQIYRRGYRGIKQIVMAPAGKHRWVRRCVSQLILCLFALQLSVSAQPDASTDSVDLVLSALPDSSRLARLKELTYLSKGNNMKLYADRLLKEAERQGNTDYRGDALFVLTRYYYARNVDSMRLLIKEAEPLLLKKGRLEDLFRMKAWNIYACTKQSENDEALHETEALNKLAVKLNYPEGKEMADQALADYYYKNKLYKEALALCDDLFRRMEARNAPFIKRVNVIRQILNMGIVETEDHIYYLDKLHTYIVECERKGIANMDAETPISYVKYVYHRSYSLAAYSLKDTALMRVHLEESERLVANLSAEDKRALTSLVILYFKLTKQYEKALAICNNLLLSYREKKQYPFVLSILYKQAEFHHDLGNDTSAIACYREYIELNDSISSLAYYEELAQYKAQHDEDKQILTIKQLELEASNGRMWMLIMLLGILVITCGFLVYIANTRQRNNKLLLIAKDKAEESDRLKSSFLANINHEIRTPLNAIIGFSEILIDEKEEDLRRQYAGVIRENNGILQQLIEGILSVSRIESGKATFSYAKVALPGLMNEVFQSAHTRVTGNVILDYIPGPDIKMRTDQAHLSRILLSLLLFSIRRIQEGTVRFGYALQEDKISFYIQNTSGEMSAEEQETLFDYNLMLKSWTKGVGLGVNLELAVAKNLTDHMGGSLIVNIKELNGFAFYVNLPYS